jgi:hypothetical protein
LAGDISFSAENTRPVGPTRKSSSAVMPRAFGEIEPAHLVDALLGVFEDLHLLGRRHGFS